MLIQCSHCKEYKKVPISLEDLVNWEESGQYVQQFFPHLSANDRELLVSETCGACFDRMFGDPDDPECNGVCMFAADIGLPEYGDVVAYPHPDCPVHGDGA